MYFYQRLRINSMKEYKDFIIQCIKVGSPETNPYSKYKDEDGLEEFTSFEKIPIGMLYKYIGLKLSDQKIKKIINDNPLSFPEIYLSDFRDPFDAILNSFSDEEVTNEISSPDDISFSESFKYKIPVESDFPIIIDWNIENSFDRIGSIKTRIFSFFSIEKIQTWNSDFQKKRDLWQERYSEKFEALCKHRDDCEGQ